MNKLNPNEFAVYRHTVGIPSHCDREDKELTEILIEMIENDQIKDVHEAIKEVDRWSSLGDEKERRLYVVTTFSYSPIGL